MFKLVGSMVERRFSSPPVALVSSPVSSPAVLVVEDPLAVLPVSLSPQAAKVVHSRARAKTKARIFLSFMLIPPGFQSKNFMSRLAAALATCGSQCSNDTPS